MKDIQQVGPGFEAPVAAMPMPTDSAPVLIEIRNLNVWYEQLQALTEVNYYLNHPGA
jgi:hypothetical protein